MSVLSQICLTSFMNGSQDIFIIWTFLLFPLFDFFLIIWNKFLCRTFAFTSIIGKRHMVPYHISLYFCFCLLYFYLSFLSFLNLSLLTAFLFLFLFFLCHCSLYFSICLHYFLFLSIPLFLYLFFFVFSCYCSLAFPYLYV